MAHYERPNNMLLRCHGFKEIGSLFVCEAASIQLPHKERETRRGLRESSLCGVEGKGWIKNCLGASVFSDPNWNYKCIGEMSYLWRLCHKQAFSSLCPYDELAGPGVIKLIEGLLSGGSLGNYNSLFGALQRCCGDKGSIMRKKGRAIMYPLNGSK